MTVRRILRDLVIGLAVGACGVGHAQLPATGPAIGAGFRVGRVDTKRIPELSGLAASRRYPGRFWAHNDSGNPAELFLIDMSGRIEGRVAVAGAPNVDWEDVCMDREGWLYVADTGNNNRPTRSEVVVYRFEEPEVGGEGKAESPALRAAAKQVRPTGRWVLRWPGKAVDCEALCVQGGYGYVIPKLRTLEAPGLYRFSLKAEGRAQVLERVGEIPALRMAPVTAMTLTGDERWLGVLTVFGPYLFKVDGRVEGVVGRATAEGHVPFLSVRMEGACFVEGGLLTGNEEGELYLFDWGMMGVGGGVKR